MIAVIVLCSLVSRTLPRLLVFNTWLRSDIGKHLRLCQHWPDLWTTGPARSSATSWSTRFSTRGRTPARAYWRMASQANLAAECRSATPPLPRCAASARHPTTCRSPAGTFIALTPEPSPEILRSDRLRRKSQLRKLRDPCSQGKATAAYASRVAEAVATDDKRVRRRDNERAVLVCRRREPPRTTKRRPPRGPLIPIPRSPPVNSLQFGCSRKRTALE